MADLFISYKSERRAAAEHLAEILADYGYSVWWDYGLISGRDFGAQIETELRSAKAVLVAWCSMSVQSEWVREEASLAKRLNKMIPIIIEKTELPLGFTLAQTLDLSDWDGAPQSNLLERLFRDIGQFVGRPPKPNLEGLERTERAWRRFGAPTLREFALVNELERKLPPRTLPSALHAPSEQTEKSRQETGVGTSSASSQRFAESRQREVGFVKVITADPASQGKTIFFIDGTRLKFGRDPSNDIVVEAPDVSRFHCGIVATGASMYLEDYHSTNGTILNGKRVQSGERTELAHGDEITISNCKVRIGHIAS
jgi:hypothetical protein